jgi:hypothetical protein
VATSGTVDACRHVLGIEWIVADCAFFDALEMVGEEGGFGGEGVARHCGCWGVLRS